MNLLSSILLVLVVVVISAEKIRFDYHKIFSLKVENVEQMKVLKQLEETPEGEYVFGDSPVIGRNVEVVVPPHKLYEFGGIMNNFNIIHDLKVDNLQT